MCDACEADRFAYTVNDILVSDFYTPALFFEPEPIDGLRYSFTAWPTRPRAAGYETRARDWAH